MSDFPNKFTWDAIIGLMTQVKINLPNFILFIVPHLQKN